MSSTNKLKIIKILMNEILQNKFIFEKHTFGKNQNTSKFIRKQNLKI